MCLWLFSSSVLGGSVLMGTENCFCNKIRYKIAVALGGKGGDVDSVGDVL